MPGDWSPLPTSMLLDNAPCDFCYGIRVPRYDSVPLLEFLVDTIAKIESPTDSLVKTDMDRVIDHSAESFEETSCFRSWLVFETDRFERVHYSFLVQLTIKGCEQIGVYLGDLPETVTAIVWAKPNLLVGSCSFDHGPHTAVWRPDNALLLLETDRAVLQPKV